MFEGIRLGHSRWTAPASHFNLEQPRQHRWDHPLPLVKLSSEILARVRPSGTSGSNLRVEGVRP